MTATEARLQHRIRSAAVELTAAGVPSAEADAVALAAHVLACEPHEVRRRMVLREAVDAAFTARFGDLVRERASRIPCSISPGRPLPASLLVGRPRRVRPPTRDRGRGPGGDRRGPAVRSRPARRRPVRGIGSHRARGPGRVPHARVVAVELDPLAIAWARRNVERTGRAVELVEGDATTVLPELDARVDVVVSNPPYIPTGMVPRTRRCATTTRTWRSSAGRRTDCAFPWPLRAGPLRCCGRGPVRHGARGHPRGRACRSGSGSTGVGGRHRSPIWPAGPGM